MSDAALGLGWLVLGLIGLVKLGFHVWIYPDDPYRMSPEWRGKYGEWR